jgi:hypothetical protein
LIIRRSHVAGTRGVFLLILCVALDNRTLNHRYLWKVMDKPAPLNPLLASFFSKVVQTLLQKEIEPLTTYLLGNPPLLFKLIGHLGTPAVMASLTCCCSVSFSFLPR